MIFEHNDYRSYLRDTLNERAKTRGGYSLRGFAEKVCVSNSFLSEVLNRKKALSVELAFKMAVKLDLTDLETQYFCLLVQLDQEKNPEFREEFRKRLKNLNPKKQTRDLSAEIFKIISEWYHLAILELTYLPSFKGTPEFIATKLGISKSEAQSALKRLLQLQLIERDNKGELRKSQNYLLAESAIPNLAFKQYHKATLNKAIESLDCQSPQERMSSTDVLAFDSKHLPEVDRLSQEFSAAVMKLSDKSKFKDSVYALSVHFFNLTKTREKKL